MTEANVQTSELYTLQLPSKPESITLLEQTRNNTTRLSWAVLQCSRSGVTVKTAHGNSKQGTQNQQHIELK